MRRMCITAAASVTPSRSASCTAAISRSHPSLRPARTSEIISRVPPPRPLRCSSFFQSWKKLEQRHGRGGGTREMISLVRAGLSDGWDRLIAAVQEALRLGVTDAAAVMHILRMPDAEERRCYQISLSQELAEFERPQPVMDEYDLLLAAPLPGKGVIQ